MKTVVDFCDANDWELTWRPPTDETYGTLEIRSADGAHFRRVYSDWLREALGKMAVTLKEQPP